MTQSQLYQAIAQATGDDVEEIAHLGFSLIHADGDDDRSDHELNENGDWNQRLACEDLEFYVGRRRNLSS